MIEKLEADLATIGKAIEQAMSNLNILHGQKQGIEHCLDTIKGAAKDTEAVAESVEHAAEVGEQMIEPAPAS